VKGNMFPRKDRSLFVYKEIEDDLDEGNFIPVYIIWGKNYWGVEIESYTDPYLLNPLPIEDEHFRFILQKFGIPDGIIPLRSVEALSPAKLDLLKGAIDELGGATNFEALIAQLTNAGISIHSYLGSGGWGHVFRVTRSKSPQDAVLKILRPPYNDEWRRRFEKEAHALKKTTDCPGAAKLVDGIQEIGGLLVLQMEFVEGNTLSDLELPVNPRLAYETIRETLRVLDVVHQKGIIHRDLHLGNLIKTKNGIVVVDFGLARDEYGLEYYKTFKPVGAMSHCAPEKWLDSSKAGPASDIFSVGVMLYRLLTGKFPFWSDTYIGLYEIIKVGEFPPPSKRSPGSFPDFFDLIVKEMLHPSLAHRVASARAALAMLESTEGVLELWEKYNGR